MGEHLLYSSILVVPGVQIEYEHLTNLISICKISSRLAYRPSPFKVADMDPI